MRLVIAGGGTGGHLFPGLALAEELLCRGSQHAVLFLGARGGMEERIVPLHGYRLELLPSLKGGLFGFSAARKAWDGCHGYLQARKAILQFKADAVVGMGGYASALPVLAAWGVEVPCVLMEGNVIPGRTNRMLARFADEIGVQFMESTSQFARPQQVKHVGNPLRRKLARLGEEVTRTKLADSKADSCPKEPVVLVLGGSQGARALNDLAVRMWAKLKHAVPGVRVLLVSGREDEQRAVQDFAGADVRGQVIGFTEAMEDLYAQADVVLARAGAMTLAEIAIFGLPSVLIPYPYAADDHQTANAQVFSARGAASMMIQKNIEIERLVQRIADALLQPERRRKMIQAATSLASPRAAADVIDRVEALVARKSEVVGMWPEVA